MVPGCRDPYLMVGTHTLVYLMVGTHTLVYLMVGPISYGT